MGTSVIWRHGFNYCRSHLHSAFITGTVGTHLGLDDKRPVSSYRDLLLHDAEPVEPADEQSGAVQPQGEVHVVTGEAALVVLDVLTPVHIEEEEVMKVASGEGLPLSNAWYVQRL